MNTNRSIKTSPTSTGTFRSTSRRLAAVGFALSIVASACTNSSSSNDSVTPSTVDSAPVDNPTDTKITGNGNNAVAAGKTANFEGPAPRLFEVKLSEGVAPSVPEDLPLLSSGEDLEAARIAELIAKLPAWEDPKVLATPFAFPAQSSPPPRTGKTVSQVFPPASTNSAQPPATDSGPLKVLRVQPEGNVPIAPYVAITFNQPMVPIGMVGQVAGSNLPVRLEPAVAGSWQWIGTRTLRFDVDPGQAKTAIVDRLPMATTFSVTVPAETKSATGSALGTAASFTFSTPAPKVEQFTPQNEGIKLNPIFVATFDQRVDPAAVVGAITVQAGNENLPVRVATQAEIDGDETAKNLAKSSTLGRWVAFTPTRALTTDTTFVVSVGPNTPSAEGPIKTSAAQKYNGRTYGALRARVSCSFGDQCPPGTELYVTFSNPLDVKVNTATNNAKITVSPALPAQEIIVTEGIQIRGVTKARTNYTVKLPASLTDIYGQTLGTDQALTIDIGAATKSLQQLGYITTLDPFADSPKLSILSTNHSVLRVRIFEADPAKFAEYVSYAERRDDPSMRLPNWKVLADSQTQPKGKADDTIESVIDLTKALNNKRGQAIVLVDPIPAPKRDTEDYYASRPLLSWVQNTTMALDALYGASELKVWATDLRTGKPIANAPVTTSNGQSGTTNNDGLATIPLAINAQMSHVKATNGSSSNESFLLPINAYGQAPLNTLRWFAFDDRQMYRPGETLRLKGWVRKTDGVTGAISSITQTSVDYTVNDANGVELLKGSAPFGPLGGFDLSLAISKTANVGPASINMEVSGQEGLGNFGHQFQIAEFRRPEFEVNVSPVSPAPFVSTGPITVSATASYLGGGALPNAPVAWAVSTGETTYSPAGWEPFTFGIFQPWWLSDFGRGGPIGGFAESDIGGRFGGPGGPRGNATVKQYNAVTDASGKHVLQLDFTGDSANKPANNTAGNPAGNKGGLPDLPVSVSVAGTVTDVNRQAWSDQQSLLVHSAIRYVGLRSDRSFVRQGDPLNIEAIVTDLDGKAQPNTPLTVTAGLLRSTYTNGKFVESIVDPQTCTVTSATEAAKCAFKTPVGGQYRVTSTVTDANGGRNRTELSVWVSGAASESARTVDQEALTVIPDQKTYKAGDIAKLLVQAPFVEGEGLAIISHGGKLDPIRFTLTNGSAEISVPIAESDIPRLSVNIEVVGATVRTAVDGTKLDGSPKRPAYAAGGVTLSVPAVTKTLRVVATPAVAALKPGESTKIAVTVNDSTGAPVRDAEFAVVVVDEAILGLTNYKLGDPVAAFHQGPYDFLTSIFGRSQVRLLDVQDLANGASSPGNGGAVAETQAASADASALESSVGGAPNARLQKSAAPAPASGRFEADKNRSTGGSNPVSIRSNFDALALFQPTVRTDANGKASVEVTLPDNLTRYRVMVVAASGADRFGTAEGTITARLPLAVRPSAPRFLNTGDAFELPVVVQNSSTKDTDVDVIVQLANLDATGTADTTGTTGTPGKRVAVKAGDRIEVRFPVKVRSAGTAKFRATAFAVDGSNAAATLKSDSDSAEVSLPVFTPGTVEAFATYGVLDEGTLKQPLLTPKGVQSGFGGLEISTSSTSLQALTDAVLYIDTYDYKSSDAYASRILAIGALRGVLKDFSAQGLASPAQLNAAVERDIAGLIALQNDDGGFPFWNRSRESIPYNSIQSTHALVLAKQAGYAVAASALERALQWLVNIDNTIVGDQYSQNERDALRAYALNVLALAGQRDQARAALLVAERGDKLALDAMAWVWGSLDNPADKALVERTINNRAVDTAGAVSFASSYADNEYLILQSSRRTDALVLDSLIANAPKSDLVDKVVTGLLANRVKGHWSNCQENAFALLALKRYYDTYEASTPNFVARTWLGEKLVGTHTFAGRTIERSAINVPMAQLVGDSGSGSGAGSAGNRDVVISKDGAGRLYYRIGLRYVPADLKLAALDRGFVIDRVYEAVDSKTDVQRGGDGVWKIKAGAKVRVKLTMVAESQRTHVALIDPLPAGLEALNPVLAVTQPIADSNETPIERSWWWGTWYDHQQFRDDRSEAYTSFLPGGVYNYSYIARATTPGSFIVPPTRAEEMYAPETFGRSASDQVIIG